MLFFFYKSEGFKEEVHCKDFNPCFCKKNKDHVRAGFALKPKYLDHLGLFCENKRPDDLSGEVNDRRRSVH